MRRSGTLLAVLLVLATVPIVVPGETMAASDTPDATAVELADRYAPIVMLKRQSAPCNSDGEQYVPAPVGIVLGNPQVMLQRGPSTEQSGFKTIATGPTTADVANLGGSYYLNLPGDPLHAGCTYEQDSKRLMAGRSPTTYAQVAQEPGVTGVALQYWFFYYFNQFNDVHEGDWEMIQLVWDGAATPQDALGRPPDRIALAQHGGGEVAAWDSSKLEKQGDHPVVYPASGSHATYYGANLYLGTGQNGAGFGCDNALAPSRAVPLTAVVLPHAPDPSGPYAWLTYDGKWGQYEPALNNGPDGPMQHSQWRQPFRWMDGLRTSSPTVPLGTTFGPSVTGAFCGTIAKGSALYNQLSHHPEVLLLIVLALVLAAILAIRHTVWSPAPPEPLDQRRHGGQIFVAAGRIYAGRFGTFLMIGALFLPISILSALLQHLLFETSGLSALLESADSQRTGAVIALLVGSFGTVVAYNLVVGVVAAGVRERLHGEPLHWQRSYRAIARRFWKLVAAQLIVTLSLIALVLTVIGIPFAVKKAVDWVFSPWEVVLEGRSPRSALRASTVVVHDDWWTTAGFTTAVVVSAVAIGPIAGFILIFTTSAPLSLINVLGSIAYTMAVPYAALVLSLLYLEVRARDTTAPPP